jgi:uncharacterized protein YcfL
MKKNILVLKLIVLVLFSCNSQTKKDFDNSEVLFEIIFANGFKSDEIILLVNNNKVTKSILNSNKSDGLTSLAYKIIAFENDLILVNSYDGSRIQNIESKHDMFITVIYGKQEYKYDLKQSLGRYIIIEVDNGIIFDQQKEKPFFD